MAFYCEWHKFRLNVKNKKRMEILKSKKVIFVPGAQKGGTSTLHGLLTSHSQISPLSSEMYGSIKEPHFFSLVPEQVKQNFEWYWAFIRDLESDYVIDSSTSYLMAPAMPQLARKSFPDSKVIFILRDPVKRAFSGYLQMASKMPSRDQRDFSEIVNKIHQRYKEVGIKQAENEVLKEAIQEGLVDDEYFGLSYLSDRLGASFQSRFQDPLWPYKYFQNSQYSRRLKSYKTAFESEELIVVGLEHLSDDTDAVATDIFRFLGLAKKYTAPGRTNRTTIPTTFGRLYKRLNDVVERIPFVREASNSFLLDPLKDLLRDRVMRRKKRSTNQELSEDVQAKAEEILRSEYENWKERSFTEYWGR